MYILLSHAIASTLPTSLLSSLCCFHQAGELSSHALQKNLLVLHPCHHPPTTNFKIITQVSVYKFAE